MTPTQLQEIADFGQHLRRQQANGLLSQVPLQDVALAVEYITSLVAEVSALRDAANRLVESNERALIRCQQLEDIAAAALAATQALDRIRACRAALRKATESPK